VTEDDFEMPDLEGLAEQMEDALAEAQKAMADLPTDMGDLGGLMGSLSSLVGGLPADLGELSGAISGFEAQHEANVASARGEPDWGVEADIRAGTKLHVVIGTEMDLAAAAAAYESTQGEGFESLVGGILAGVAGVMGDGVVDQVMGQLKKGRTMAAVTGVEVLACRFRGAPSNAAEELVLSPEAGILLSVDGEGIGFELAPLLTVKNRWEHADIPTFTPMGESVVVPLDAFDAGSGFERRFVPDGQDEDLSVTLRFSPLNA